MGGRAVACINARDRNVLGFRRDLLTAAAYGVEEFLFVYGDRPETGTRSDDLTVRTMVREARSFADEQGIAPYRVGMSCGLGAVPAWKREADALYTQVSYSAAALEAWRPTVDVDAKVYAGVMVLASASMARKLSHDVPQLAVPADVVDALDRDRRAGIDLACELVLAIRDSGAFDGVHLIPVGRYRETAAELEALLAR